MELRCGMAALVGAFADTATAALVDEAHSRRDLLTPVHFRALKASQRPCI
jgi:hypothetical protein